MATTLGVTEGAVRYQHRRQESGTENGRSKQSYSGGDVVVTVDPELLLLTAATIPRFVAAVNTWDPFNMMQSMSGGGNDAFHVYTSDDERFCTLDLADPLNLFTYRLRGLDGQVVREFSLSFKRPTPWLWEKDWVRRDGTLLASASSSEGIRHYHPDHLGTPRLVTDAIKGVVAIQSFFPFGEQLQINQTAEAMKFTGHERDYNTDEGNIDDLDYMHARYFSSMTGRMLSTDLVDGDPVSPQGWNKYSYVMNRPVSLVDPRGLFPCPGMPDIDCQDSITVTAIDPLSTASVRRFLRDAQSRLRSDAADAVRDVVSQVSQTTPVSGLPSDVVFIDGKFSRASPSIEDLLILAGSISAVAAVVTGGSNGVESLLSHKLHRKGLSPDPFVTMEVQPKPLKTRGEPGLGSPFYRPFPDSPNPAET